jgi:ATP-dependent DNA helicase DinG
VELFFEKIFEEYGKKDCVLRFYSPPVIDNTLYIPLQELYESLKTLESRLDSEEDQLEITSAANRCFEFNNALTACLNQHMQDYVYWMEITARKYFPRVTLKGVPIDVARELQEQVFDKVDRVVITSATLTTNKTFDFVKNRTGYQPEEELILATPFDYASQALLYIPEDLPLPNTEPEPYFEALANRCHELIQAAEGKTFILFTSYQTLNRVYEKLEFLGNEYQLLKQGDLSPNQMIHRFKEIPSVIFGTNSFWQGVDIPGEALKSVIITKLPFDVPSEPLTEARMEALRKMGIDPFRHYQIPRAIIQLKQGFGRLIRKKSDTGVVSILDSRMVHRSYGKQFLASLPECTMSRELADVRDFLSSATSGRQAPAP